jgi:putative CocE/NonD family hydrolase
MTMRWYLFVLALLSLLSFPSQAQEEEKTKDAPFAISQGVYVIRLAEQWLGEEEVSFTPQGWQAKGKVAVMGHKAAYEAKLERRSDDSLVFSLVAHSGQTTTDYVLELLPDKAVWQKPSQHTLELAEAKKPVFLYTNLLWAHMYDVGVYLTREAASGKLVAGQELTGLLTQRPFTFPWKVGDFKQITCVWQEKPVQVWSFFLDIGVEIELVCTPAGLPLRILVPAQRLDIVLSGYEAIEGVSQQAKTIVDYGPWRERLSQPQHEVTVDEKVMMPMRDGVKLSADIYRPKAAGKFPTVLGRTPYSRTQEALLRATFWARRGYVFVAQDVRGRFESEGEWFPFRNEINDGSDTLDWIAAQPWSDGKVGMVGASYVGLVQWYAARSGNVHLKAIVPEVSPPDPDQNFPYEGGVFMLGTAWWAKLLEILAQPDVVGQLKSIDWVKVLQTLPLTDLDKTLGVQHKFLDEWLRHAPTDSYWQQMRYQDAYAHMDLAVLNISGWYDGDQPGAVMNFIGMRHAAKSEAARKAQYLIMGPWGHAVNITRKLGNTDFGPEAVVDLNAVVLRFFDHYLKGIDMGLEQEDPVLVFVMGENKWHREKNWPLPQTVFTKLFLTSGGDANKRDGSGGLSLTCAEDATPDSYRYDPNDIQPTLTDFNDFVGNSATTDYSVLADRSDVLDFVSPPLAQPMELTGPFTVTLTVASDAEDTDFGALVFCLKPGGQMYGQAGGIQRLRYCTGQDRPVKPGETATVEIDCWASGVKLAAGDRLLLQITSALFPGYARNLNTLEESGTAKTAKVAQNVIFHDARRPSYLLLPFIPRAQGESINFK